VSALKPCPVDGCEARIAPRLLMCGFHWRLVPGWLRRRVWQTYRNGDGVLEDAYLEVAAKAIEAAETARAA
jgi:hypothetical protein